MSYKLFLVIASFLLASYTPKSELPVVFPAKIVCGNMVGSGVYLSNNLLVTAEHVTSKTEVCLVDGQAAAVISENSKLDYSLVFTESKRERLQVYCGGFKKGEKYSAVGWAGGDTIFRTELEATDMYYKHEQLPSLAYTRVLIGKAFEGMSGGAIYDSQNRLVGILNGIVSSEGVEYTLSREISHTSLCGIW